MLYQNFGMDNLVFYYEKAAYSERDIINLLKGLILYLDIEDIHIRLYFGSPMKGATL